MSSAEAGFDPNRSQVSADRLAKFLDDELVETITSVPGVAAGNAEALGRRSEGDNGVRTSYALVGKFLSLREPGMTPQEHCDAFWHWLKLKGVNSYRSGIVHAVAEKCDLAFPGIYRAREE